MQIESIVSLSIAGLALIFTALSFRRTSGKDISEFATTQANLTADVRYIRQSIDEIKVEYRSVIAQIGELRDRVVCVEQSTKSAHKRLDDHTRETAHSNH